MAASHAHDFADTLRLVAWAIEESDRRESGGRSLR